MVIARDAIPTVELPREVVLCEPLGGDVIVQGMNLSQALTFFATREREIQPKEGETEEAAVQRSGIVLIPLVLSMCVLAADEKPVYSEAQWSVWCGRNLVAAVGLFKVATRLSGTDAADKKKD